MWEAKNTAAEKGITLKAIGSGETVVSQYPEANSLIPKGGVVVVYTEGKGETAKATVPDFTGKTVAEVNILAAENSLNVIFSGPTEENATVAYSQSLEEGTSAEAGTTVTVYFRNTFIPED